MDDTYVYVDTEVIKEQADFKAQRWVGERVHSWMNRFRRLLIRWDKKPENYLAFSSFCLRLDRFSRRQVIRIGTYYLTRLLRMVCNST